MARPRLTFACELDAARLTALFANGSVLENRHVLGSAAAAAWMVRGWRTARR
jgi:hypothetical protein